MRVTVLSLTLRPLRAVTRSPRGSQPATAAIGRKTAALPYSGGRSRFWEQCTAMSNTDQEQRSASRPSLYQEITDKIIRQIEAGTIPWVQPWAGNTSLSIPRNASTQRAYSGINIVLLWDALFSRQYEINQWLTFRQALALGGNVKKGERGTTVVYADSFVPKKDGQKAPDAA